MSPLRSFSIRPDQYLAHAYSFPRHLTPVSSTPGFIAALFTIAKTQKQHKCPLADEWIKKRWSIYTVEHDSTVKKKEIMPFAATWMDLESVTLSEISDREAEILHNIPYMWNLKQNYPNDFTY